MNLRNLIWHVFVLVILLALLSWWGPHHLGGQTSSEWPNRPVQIVVPYAAGGGSDTFVRIIQRGIVEDDLLPVPLVVLNQAGGIGTIGSREVKNAPPDGYKLLCHHNAIITAKLSGTVSYGPEAFMPIAMTGEMSMVVLVRGDAPYESIAELLQHAKAEPRTLRMGANLGAPAHFTAKQLEKAVEGAKFSIVSSGGGADRYAKIIGGHLEAGIFSLSEYLDFRGVEGTPPERDIKAIAVLSPERHESIPNVPTAHEVGVPVLLSNANYWWAPLGTPSTIIDKFASVLQQAMQNETVRSELKRIRMDPVFDQGASLRRRLEETEGRFESVIERKELSLPNFPLYVSLTCIALLALSIWEAKRQRKSRHEEDEFSPGSDVDPSRSHPGVALASLVVLAAYVALLGRWNLPFALLSAAMVMTVGGLMLRAASDSPSFTRWLILLELSFLTGFGAEFIFTEIFVTPLP